MPKSRNVKAGDESSLCQYPFADGRTCRMLRYRAHPTLCVFHAQQEQQLLTEAEQMQNVRAIASELASLSGTFGTMSDIHHVAGKLFELVAANRVPRRQAQNLTYLLQIISQAQRRLHLEQMDAGAYDVFDNLLQKVYPNGREARAARDRAARAQRDGQAAESAAGATPPTSATMKSS
jgi:hypothetical protein